MWILFDFIIIAIIAITTFLGYKRGFAKTLIKFASFFLAILISLIIYKPISNYIINNTSIQPKLENSIETNLMEKFNTEDENTEVEVSSFILNYIQKNNTDIKNTTIDIVAKSISELLIKVIIFIVLFIIIKVILFVLILITDIITKLPILKQFNDMGGLIIGLLKGFILVYIILGILSLLSGITNLTTITNIINNSIITKLLYNNNFLFMILF